MTPALPTHSRRTFLIQSSLATSAMFLGNHAFAQAAVAENDPQATALGYKADATKVDKTKQAKYVAGQNCSNCALFNAKAGSHTGACPLFAGKTVASKGWCSAWVKKA